MTSRRPGVPFVLAACGLSCLSPTVAQAQCANPTAQIVRIANRVDRKEAATDVFVPATLNLDVCDGDSIRAGERSRATIAFRDRSVVLTIDQNTEWVVRKPSEPKRSLIDLIRGAILFFTREPLEIQTPFANATVEGTEFLVRVEDDRTLITVFEGHVQATNPSGSLTLTSNQSAVAQKGQAPQLQIIVRPRDAVQWALYYQPLLADDSLEQRERIPEVQRDAQFYVRRAGLLLAVGRLDEARADIKEALDRDPNAGEAYALLSVIAVALNDRTEALANGREAVRRSPKSAASRVALSYALQANFELEAARDQLTQAVADQSDDARAWARLSELWLSLGDLDRAQAAAERAAKLAPDVARASTVLGFAALTRVDTSGARTAFERAIALERNNPNPLAMLGLGLAKIRSGDLDAGRHDIEIAAALSPDDPIVRSYLGKAYFEEKREPLPDAQFELAKTLDPRDPTPWFYDAIRKQTLNRPVEALQDLQKSIDLNDNRAVYRSRLLLDQDQAARSASLGRIYRDLGFEQLALVEGWKSVGADPTDYSGHRFLADTYSALPRHEIARVSELLQSQLLQPINITAIQPQLAESNLFIVERSGPSAPGFNEFNPLLNRNRVAFQGSGIVGGNGTLGDDLVLNGVWNKLSFSVGQFHFDSDGFRVNNHQVQDIYDLFVQASVTPLTSVQAEIRSRTAVRGDLPLRFNPDSFSPNLTQDDEFQSARVGFHHAFAGGSDVIASLVYGDSDGRAEDQTLDLGFPGNPGSLQISVRRQGWTGEFQHLYRRRRFRLTSGVGHFNADVRETVDFGIRLPVPPFIIPVSSQSDRDQHHTNIYEYAQFDYPTNVTFTLGASGDFYDDGRLKINQFNPKFGAIWHLKQRTTLRGAAVRTLKRSLTSDQTIEPTQIAGFNQFFDGNDGEEAWRYGIAVDQELSGTIHGGVEFSWRDLEVPTVSLPELQVRRNNRTERLGRAYFYLTPHPTVALSAQYMFERFRREQVSGVEEIVELDTHRIPLQMSYFHRSGLIARFGTTIVKQRGVFGSLDEPVPGADSFAVFDASIGIRLPKRYGLVSLNAQNLFGKKFKFQDTDPANPTIVPKRLVVVRFTATL